MARVPMIDPGEHPELAGLVDRISGARRGKLLNLYKALLQSPPVAEGWFGHINGLRFAATISGRLRELLIIRVAYLADAAYALRQHIPKLAAAEGVDAATCAALADWQASPGLFSEAERAALAFADEVTLKAKASDATFGALAAHYDPRAIVEITVLVSTYNMHARFTNALQLDLEVDP